MNKLNATLVTTALLTCCMVGTTLSEEAHGSHEHHGHDTRGMEMGFSAGYVHLENEDEDAPVLHVHLSKRLQDEGIMNRFALGVGGEVIFAEHEHYAVMVPLFVYPWRGLALSVAPSVVFAEHEGEWESDYATHFEAAYVFEIGEYDMGPVVGYSTSSEDKHYMVGLHFGVHF